MIITLFDSDTHPVWYEVGRRSQSRVDVKLIGRIMTGTQVVNNVYHPVESQVDRGLLLNLRIELDLRSLV